MASTRFILTAGKTLARAEGVAEEAVGSVEEEPAEWGVVESAAVAESAVAAVAESAVAESAESAAESGAGAQTPARATVGSTRARTPDSMRESTLDRRMAVHR